MYNIRMCAGSLLNSISSSCGGIGLVWIGPCGGFPNFIFIFLFFFPAPSQTRRYLRSYRGKREEEKEGEKGGGERKKEEPRNARSFSNSTIHQSAPGLILVSLSILFFSILAFISFFSLYLHTQTEKERKR